MQRVILLFLLGLSAVSCRNENKPTEAKINLMDKFKGHWLIKNYFDSLSLGKLSAGGYGITEFVIGHDSITWMNEDTEEPYKMALQLNGRDSLKAEHSFIVYDHQANTFHFRIDERYPE